MDPFNHPQFHTDREKVKLLASEKAMMRARIIGARPAPTVSPFHDLFFVPALRGVAIAMGLMIVVTGPVTYGAQLSGPGDLLYALEVGLVEPVEEALQFTPEAKQKYHAERLAERLSELRKVEVRRVALSPEESEDVVEDVAEHAEEASKDEEPSAERILPHLIRTAALLSAHEEVLTDMGVEDARISALADTLEVRIEARIREYLTGEEDTEIVADIAEKLDRADDVLPEITSRNDAEAFTKRFEEIQDAVEEGDVDEAFVDATELEIDLLTEEYLQEE